MFRRRCCCGCRRSRRLLLSVWRSCVAALTVSGATATHAGGACKTAISLLLFVSWGCGCRVILIPTVAALCLLLLRSIHVVGGAVAGAAVLLVILCVVCSIRSTRRARCAPTASIFIDVTAVLIIIRCAVRGGGTLFALVWGLLLVISCWLMEIRLQCLEGFVGDGRDVGGVWAATPRCFTSERVVRRI